MGEKKPIVIRLNILVTNVLGDCGDAPRGRLARRGVAATGTARLSPGRGRGGGQTPIPKGKMESYTHKSSTWTGCPQEQYTYTLFYLYALHTYIHTYLPTYLPTYTYLYLPTYTQFIQTQTDRQTYRQTDRHICLHRRHNYVLLCTMV